MNKVVNLNDRRKGAFAHIESVITLNKERHEFDFNVISHTFIPTNTEKEYTAIQIYNTTTKNLFLLWGYNIQKIASKEKMIAIKSEVPNVPFNLYKIKGKEDFDLAIELGLGVMFYDSEFWLYYPELNEEPQTAVVEMLLIKVYLQLMNPDQLDLKFKEGYNKSREFIKSNILLNAEKHIKKLDSIFEF